MYFRRSRSIEEDPRQELLPRVTPRTSKWWWIVFYIFCFLSGQYINVGVRQRFLSRKKFLLAGGLIIFVFQVVSYLYHIGTALTVQVYRIVAYSSIEPAECAIPAEYWEFSSAISVGTIGAFLSYSSITCLILIPVNCLLYYKSKFSSDEEDSEDSTQCCCASAKGCCTVYKKVYRNGALSPYNDDDESAKMSTMETCFFAFNYLVVLVLLICSFVTSVIYVHSVYSQDVYNNQDNCWINALDISRIVLHLITQFCVVQTCFIFSKISYKVTAKLDRLVEQMDVVSDNLKVGTNHFRIQNSSEMSRSDASSTSDKEMYSLLQEVDRAFVKQVKPTLDLYGVWFIFHFVSYAVTTLLLVRYVFEIIVNALQGGERNPTTLLILYLVFFTLVHAYLFLYPCFRAAAIGEARAKLIHTISNRKWNNVPLLVQSNFVQYLTVQNFGFRVPLFCANIKLQLNWFYASLFVLFISVYGIATVFF